MSSVDVAITSYQYARFLRQSTASVLGQDVNLRLLIVDNASTDGSQEIARQLAAEDARVSLILNEQNQGYHSSLNRAIDWADADYFVLLDADDLLFPRALALGLDYMARNPGVAFCYGVEGRLVGDKLDPGRCNSASTRWSKMSGEAFIRRTCWDSFCDVGAPAVIRRTAAQKRAGHFRRSLVRTFDFEMYMRLALVGDVASTNRVLGVRRMHPMQISTPYVAEPTRDFTEHERAFESFFAHEGAALAEAPLLMATARARMGDYAYCYGLLHRLTDRARAEATFAFARERRGLPWFVPPFHFFFKRRWLRSILRNIRRLIRQPEPLPAQRAYAAALSPTRAEHWPSPDDRPPRGRSRPASL